MFTVRCSSVKSGDEAPARRPAQSTGVRRAATVATVGLLLAALTACGDPDEGGGGGGYVVGTAFAGR